MFRAGFRIFRFSTWTILLLIAGRVEAQTGAAGMIAGRVLDIMGRPLAAVTVEAAGPGLTTKPTATTDGAGTFLLTSLPPGSYEITFSLAGYQPRTLTALVEGSETVNLAVTLEPGGLTEEAVIVGGGPLIDFKSAAKVQTLNRELLLSLPRSREFDGLLDIIPGVQQEDIVGGLSVEGGSGAENVWALDGADITHIHFGTKAQAVVVEFINEVRTAASGYNPELGGATGGIISIVTRPGGETFHGEISSYYQNNALWMLGRSRDYLRQDPYDDQVYGYFNDDESLYGGGKDRDDWHRVDGTFSLGGNILKDKFWFFLSLSPGYSQTRAARSFLSDQDPQNKEPFTETNRVIGGAIKLTAAPSSRFRLSASVNGDFSSRRGMIPSIYGTSEKSFPWSKAGLDRPGWTTAGTIDWSLSDSILVSLRGGWTREDQMNQQTVPPTTVYTFGRSNAPYTDDPELVRYRGWTNWPGGSTEIKKRLYEWATAGLDFTVFFNLAGAHSLKAGLLYTRLHEDVEETAPHPQVIVNWGIPYFGLASAEPVMGQYGYYEVRGSWTSPYGYFWDIASDRWAVYLQDSWTIGGRLTINAGLRAENEYIPSFGGNPTAPTYKPKPIEFGFQDKIAPRLGFILDVFGDSRLKVFGSYGIFFDVMKLYLAESAYGGFQWVSDYYELDTLDWPVIAASGDLYDRTSQEAGGRYLGSMHWRLPSWDTTDPGLQPTSQREISFGAEQRLAENVSFSVRFTLKHLVRTVEDVGLLTPLGEQYYIANPGQGWSLPVSQGGMFPDEYWPTPRAKRDYAGLDIALLKRFSNNWQGGVSYTWSRTVGNYGGLSGGDAGGEGTPNAGRSFDLWFMAYDLESRAVDGVLPQDRTHLVKVFGSYALPFGLTVGLAGTGRSGLPQTTRLDVNNAYLYPLNSGNLERLPFTAWIDLYLEYTLRLGRASASLNLQINNITNTKTWQARDTELNRVTMPVSDEEILSQGFDYRERLPFCDPNPAYLQFTRQFSPWSARLGLRLSY
jgi:hypothetical protein